MRCLKTLIVLCAITSTVFSNTLLVPSQYATIQAGINAAVDGDTVLVASGVYYEAVDFLSKKIVLLSESGAISTVIDPDSECASVTIDSVDVAGAVIEGFTITNSFDDFYPGVELHGIYCYKAFLEIRNNIITDIGYWFSATGAGIYAFDSYPVIEDNLIAYNECAYYGAGIHIWHCDSSIVRNNTIAENYLASGWGFAYGAGIAVNESKALIEKNLIRNNETDSPEWSEGGGICLYGDSKAEIINNTLYQNLGIGINIIYSDSCQIKLRNNIIAENIGGGGLRVAYSGYVNLDTDYNDMWDNDPENYVNCEPGDHDIAADPLFVNPLFGDYNLSYNSPCIDAGDPNSPLDPDNTIADMGAYYYNQTVGIGDSDFDTVISDFELFTAYPNPFNQRVTLDYMLPKAAYVRISVYDLLGREVSKLAGWQDGRLEAGQHSVVWDAEGLGSGVYFIRMEAGDYVHVQKMIMLR